MHGVVATLRLGAWTLCEVSWRLFERGDRLIFLAGLEIESKWKKGRG